MRAWEKKVCVREGEGFSVGSSEGGSMRGLSERGNCWGVVSAVCLKLVRGEWR